MKDSELIILLRQVITAGLTMNGWTYPVVQRSQGTQQGIPTEPSVFFQKLWDKRYGMPGTTVLTNTPEVGKNTEVITQKMETTFQISALVIQNPEMDVNSQPTASDVVNYIAMILQRRDSVRKMLNDKNVSVLRIEDGKVPNDYFEDDRHRHEAWPTFNIVLTHEMVTSYTVNNTENVVSNVYRVPE